MLRVLVVCFVLFDGASPCLAKDIHGTTTQATVGTKVRANSSYYDERGKLLADGTCFQDVVEVAAGSPTLLHTIVRVENPETGAVIGRVYIRDVHGSCPQGDVCLDLTRSAARQLDLLERGRMRLTATVVGYFPAEHHQEHACGPTHTRTTRSQPQHRPRPSGRIFLTPSPLLGRRFGEMQESQESKQSK